MGDQSSNLDGDMAPNETVNSMLSRLFVKYWFNLLSSQNLS